MDADAKKINHLRSMTGFHRTRVDTAIGQVSVEVRSVNSRFHEAAVSLPRDLGHLEMRVRALLRGHVARGKVDCRIRWLPAERALPDLRVNLALAHGYIKRLEQLRRAAGAECISLELIAGLPGVLETVPAELDEEEAWTAMEQALERTLAGFDRDRAREGAAMGEQLDQLGARLRELTAAVAERKEEVVRLQRERLTRRLAELEEELRARFEPGRLEMEAAMFADRADVSEELVRLGAHLDRYEELLRAGGEPIGRALEFLLQEINREVNTLMSKSRDSSLAGHGLEMKAILEQIREQAQNIQ